MTIEQFQEGEYFLKAQYVQYMHTYPRSAAVKAYHHMLTCIARRPFHLMS